MHVLKFSHSFVHSFVCSFVRSCIRSVHASVRPRQSLKVNFSTLSTKMIKHLLLVATLACCANAVWIAQLFHRERWCSDAPYRATIIPNNTCVPWFSGSQRLSATPNGNNGNNDPTTITIDTYASAGCTGAIANSTQIWSPQWCQENDQSHYAIIMDNSMHFADSLAVFYRSPVSSCAVDGNTYVDAYQLNQCVPDGNGNFVQASCNGASTALKVCPDDQCSSGGCTTVSYAPGTCTNSSGGFYTKATAGQCSNPSPPPPPPSNTYATFLNWNQDGCAGPLSNGNGVLVGVCSGGNIYSCNCSSYTQMQFADQTCTVQVATWQGAVGDTCASYSRQKVYCGPAVPFDATPYVVSFRTNGGNNNQQEPVCQNRLYDSYQIASVGSCTQNRERYTCSNNSVSHQWNCDENCNNCQGNENLILGCYPGAMDSYRYQKTLAPSCPAPSAAAPAPTDARLLYQQQSIFLSGPCDLVNGATTYTIAMMQRMLIGRCVDGSVYYQNGDIFGFKAFADAACTRPLPDSWNQQWNASAAQQCESLNFDNATAAQFPPRPVADILGGTHLLAAAFTDHECGGNSQLYPPMAYSFPVGECFDIKVLTEGHAEKSFSRIDCSDPDNVQFFTCDDRACSSGCVQSSTPFGMPGVVNGTCFTMPQDSMSINIICPSRVAAYLATRNATAEPPAYPTPPPPPPSTVNCTAPVMTTGVMTTSPKTTGFKATTSPAGTTRAAPATTRSTASSTSSSSTAAGATTRASSPATSSAPFATTRAGVATTRAASSGVVGTTGSTQGVAVRTTIWASSQCSVPQVHSSLLCRVFLPFIHSHVLTPG
eukprot:TRINITY_DN1870_c0_g2_i2.p1 TRINITY_DN1870_c0_g2~~TRINITY_DN1870_c0_g2_i2.p1  ORF type:complete len:824 (+),score=207.88 TRINITY_DN1870_c0_g2_i2:315-2786(+)